MKVNALRVYTSQPENIVRDLKTFSGIDDWLDVSCPTEHQSVILTNKFSNIDLELVRSDRDCLCFVIEAYDEAVYESLKQSFLMNCKSLEPLDQETFIYENDVKFYRSFLAETGYKLGFNYIVRLSVNEDDTVKKIDRSQELKNLNSSIAAHESILTKLKIAKEKAKRLAKDG